MPVIEVAAGIPCPQTSTVTPEERRLLSEGAYGPRGARTIELDERQFQTLTWALSAEQAAAFRDWYRDTLIYGGAWFAAPATWPTPEGLVVKVRRFIGDPQWTYRGNGHWLLALNAEVRGETLLPSAGVYHWLFFGSGDDGLSPMADPSVSLAAPVVFVDGVYRSSGFANEDDSIVIPLYSLNALPTEGAGYSWAPFSGGSAPTLSAGVYEFGVGWDESNYVVLGVRGDTRGVLTLYSNNDMSGASGSTVIVFSTPVSFYPYVSGEYVGPA